jgi:hypothetical protein
MELRDIVLLIGVLVNLCTAVCMVITYNKMFKKPKGVAIGKVLSMRKGTKK